jgi:hypothetical protein
LISFITVSIVAPTENGPENVEKKGLSPQKAADVRFARWLWWYWAVIAALIVFLLTQLLQTLGRQADLQRLPDYDQLVQFDPEREGGHLRPNLNLDARGEFGAVHFITNSKGFRNNREFDSLPSPEVYRILLLGDSYVDGMRTDQEHTIGFVLQETLNAHLRKNQQVEVMISGHNNPANAWYYYQEHGRKYHPDLVILGLTVGNDFTSHNYCYGGLIPEIGEDGQIMLRQASDSLLPVSLGMLVLLPDAAYQPPHSTEWMGDKELQVRQWLAEHSRNFGYAIPPAFLISWSRRRHVYATDAFVSLGLFYRPGMPEIQAVYQDMDEMLTGMSQTVTADGATFLVVLFPVRMQVAEKDWHLLTRFYALDPDKFDLQKPNRHILTFCERWGIECLDSLPALRQWYETHREPVYRARGDMHFNEIGQRVVAEDIAAYLLTHHSQDLGLARE